MTFSQSVRTCFSKYFTFSGRASRPEYWWFFLFILVASFLLGIIDAALFGMSEVEIRPGETEYRTNSVLGGLFGLATFIPSIAAGWRRMHDTGRSGLFLFYPLIVMVGIFTYVGLFHGFGVFTDGQIDTLFEGGASLILILAIIVFFLSPFLVLWWLSRPTQPETNEWGPPPVRVTQ
ncbi:DUF805 domain-containing protein [Pseudoruegeria sp. HB172150]|uniref:DUF805 domain-containing protein n=1 Tax=Pseudoruegeria sp. HB172150 TaxID=2721164 RepID=UPI001554977A|nr:DUF805 domain-containing protein [Pseudoruegeria sp. HB172150]